MGDGLGGAWGDVGAQGAEEIAIEDAVGCWARAQLAKFISSFDATIDILLNFVLVFGIVFQSKSFTQQMQKPPKFEPGQQRRIHLIT